MEPKRVYTSSEAMKMCLNPASIPKFNPPPTVTQKTYTRPDTSSLIRPSMVKQAVTARETTNFRPAWNNVSRPFSADNAAERAARSQLMKVQTRAISPGPKKWKMMQQKKHNSLLKTPFNTDIGWNTNVPAAPMPHYSSLRDPHLYEYYARKFASHLQPRHRTPTRRKTNESTYKVIVNIGEQLKSRSTANLYLTVYGIGTNKINKRKLTKQNGSVKTPDGKRYLFKPASRNWFKLKGVDMKTVKYIVIETDGLAKKDSIFIDDVEIQNLKSKKSWTFPCFDWLSLYESDCQLSRDLFPETAKTKLKQTNYTIQTVTGSKLGAGTDSNVFVTLYGTKGTTPRHHLHAGDRSDPFEKGQTDTFSLKTKDVGELQKLRIEHDNSGGSPGWFLEHVNIQNHSTKKSWHFVCHNWLAKDEGDRRICRDLLASKGSMGTSSGRLKTYRLQVHTGNKRGAGTDANVFVTLFGDNGDSGEFQLTGSGNLFEKGDVDEFVEEMPDIGKLKKLRVRHDDSGIGPGWFLDKITVEDGRDKYEFPCSRWLATDEDDGSISRDLLTVGSSSTLTSYVIKIKTGDKRHAGTSANIFAELIAGRKAEDANQTSGRVWLEGGKMKRNEWDIFNVDVAGALSPLENVVIGHDDSGVGAGWFVDEVVVYCPSTGIEQHFPCNKWLAKDEDDGALERMLNEDKNLRKKGDKMTLWDCSVHTSDIRNGGTDANVFMVIYGDKGKSDVIALDNNSDKFERGQTDQFAFDTNNIGVPYKIRIGHDNAKPGAGWHLDSVDLLERSTSKVYNFPCKRWLADDEEDGEVVRELPAHAKHIKKPLAVHTYRVDVHTGNKRAAGTDANVFCCLYGERGDTGHRALTKSSTHKNKFERGNVDTFTIEAVSLKKINKLAIGHDGSGPGAGWFLDKVVVQQIDKPDSIVVFPCNRWLASDEDDGQLSRILFPSDSDHPDINTQNMLKTCTYRFAIETGDKKGAGTDANVFVELIGKDGTTGHINLNESQNNEDPFERGRTDLFDVEAEDVGKIKRLRIGHDGKGIGAGWYIEGVELRVPSRGEVYRFVISRWLASDEGDRRLEVDVTPVEVSKLSKEIPYEVTFVTGDKRGAGTDANVFLQIYGLEGKTETFNVRNKSDNFERGTTDVFKVNGNDVGTVQKIRVGTDGKGLASGWFLDTIRIRKPVTNSHKEDRKDGSRRSSRDRSRAGSRTDNRTHSLKRQSTFDALKHESKEKSRKGRSRSTSRSGRKRSTASRHSDDSDDHSESEKSDQTDSFESDEDSLASQTMSEMDSNDSEESGSGRGSRANSSKRRSSSVSKKGSRSANKASKSTSRSTSRNAISRNSSRSKTGRRASRDSASESEEDSESEYETYYFVCNKWFSRSEDDGQLIRELVPTDKNGVPLKDNKWNVTDYEVHVFTGNVSGAGTDANVFMCLYGEHGDTGDRQLKDSSTNMNKFERSQEDIFQVQAADLGRLLKLKVWHDNAGMGAAWYLDKVEVVDGNSGEKYIFPCEKWLSTKKDDGQICRELVAISPKLMKKLSRAGSTASLRESVGLELSAQVTQYDVFVKTGDKRGAGTDANVFLIMYGENDDTGKILLKSSKTNNNKFEAGQTDHFTAEAIGIGELQKIVIGHDNKGGFAGWYLDSVDIDCPAMGMKWHFPCARWLDADKDDGALQRELFPSKLASQQYEACVPYELTIYTSDKRNAGTSADVYVAVFGTDGKSSRQVSLCPNKSERKGYFNRGSIDKFIVQMEDVGEEVTKLRIGQDGSGWGPGWHLEKVEMKKLLAEGEGHMVYTMPCNRWLAKDEDDGSIVRDLIPTAAVKETFKRDGSIKSHKLRRASSITMKRYQVKVYTGDVSMGGTDANVFLTVCGMKGNTGRRQLKYSETHRNKFERNNVDIFSLEAGDLGDLYKIEIGHDDTLLGSDWFLDRVEVTDVDQGKACTFVAERWFGKNKEDGKLNRILYAKGFDPRDDPSEQSSGEQTYRKSSLRRQSGTLSRGDTGRAVMLDQPTKSASKKAIPYTIQVTTGDDKRAGTMAPVWVRIMGSKLDTGRLHLEIMSRDPPEFLPSTTEAFSVDAPDVGPVKEIEFALDSKSSKDACLIDNIEIHQPTKGRSYIFDIDSWFGRGQGDGKCKRIFTADEAAETLTTTPKAPFELVIETGDKKGSGTDCGVTVQLFGVEGSTSVINIDKDGNMFERGAQDIIQIDMEDVGEPRKLRVGLCQGKKSMRSSRDDWFVENVELVNVNKDKTYVFPCHQWISLKDQPFIDIPAVTAKGKKIIKDTDYGIFVKTGDVRGAGTDANVCCIIFGENGNSGDIPLAKSESHRDKFERNHVDLFKVINIPSLGELTKLRIWHDNKGAGASWLLDEVIVQDASTDKQYKFPCGKWLSNSMDDKQLTRELECVNNHARRRSTVDAHGNTSYDIKVLTGDKRDAGTAHNAWVILYDDQHTSDKLWLENSSRKKILQKGQEDNFTFKHAAMGPLQAIKVGHHPKDNVPYDESRHGDRDNAWYCYEVQITDNRTKDIYTFACDAWIPLSTRSRDAVQVECAYTDQHNTMKEMKRGMSQYEVSMVTGNERGAGTDGDVHVTIFGANGDSGRRALRRKGTNLFERNHTDNFFIESADLGKLKGMLVELDCSGANVGGAWLLDRIVITKEDSKATTFLCGQWLKPKSGYAEIELRPR